VQVLKEVLGFNRKSRKVSNHSVNATERTKHCGVLSAVRCYLNAMFIFSDKVSSKSSLAVEATSKLTGLHLRQVVIRVFDCILVYLC